MILLIEDNEQLAKCYLKHIRKDFNVKWINTQEDLKESLTDEIKLILADVNMNGWTSTKYLEGYEDKTILFTNYSGREKGKYKDVWIKIQTPPRKINEKILAIIN